MFFSPYSGPCPAPGTLHPTALPSLASYVPSVATCWLFTNPFFVVLRSLSHVIPAATEPDSPTTVPRMIKHTSTAFSPAAPHSQVVPACCDRTRPPMAVLRILLALAMHTEMKSAWDCRDDHYRRTPREGPNYDPGNAGRGVDSRCASAKRTTVATLFVATMEGMCA